MSEELRSTVERAKRMLVDQVVHTYGRIGKPLGELGWLDTWPFHCKTWEEALDVVARLENELMLAGVVADEVHTAAGRVVSAEFLGMTGFGKHADGPSVREGLKAVLSLPEGLTARERTALVLLGDGMSPSDAWEASGLLE